MSSQAAVLQRMTWEVARIIAWMRVRSGDALVKHCLYL